MRNIKSEFIASLFILLFAYTAFQKFSHHQLFLITLQRSTLLNPIAGFISWFIPITEFGLVSLLLFPSLRKIGLLCSATLLSMFTVYISIMLLFVPKLPCSCGGIISYLSWKQHIIFNIVFILVALYGWYIMTVNKNIAIRNSRIPVI